MTTNMVSRAVLDQWERAALERRRQEQPLVNGSVPDKIKISACRA